MLLSLGLHIICLLEATPILRRCIDRERYPVELAISIKDQQKIDHGYKSPEQLHSSSPPTIPSGSSSGNPGSISTEHSSIGSHGRIAPRQTPAPVAESHDPPKERHESGQLLDCPYSDCSHNGKNGFKRKDLLQDHIRQQHEKDLPQEIVGSSPPVTSVSTIFTGGKKNFEPPKGAKQWECGRCEQSPPLKLQLHAHCPECGYQYDPDSRWYDKDGKEIKKHY